MPRVLARAGVPATLAVLALAALPSIAFGQATRTWVSGVGDDVNPCSRTAPCKTFAGAISKTAAGGEINALDSAGFGAVTITKSIAIRANGVIGGVLVSGTNAIVVQAGATDKVTLSGLDINGLGTGINGVRILSGKIVRIEHSQISGFTTAGVSFSSSTVNARLIVQDTTIHNTGASGVVAQPGTGGAVTTIRRSEIDDCSNGVTASAAGQVATVNLFRSELTDNVVGVFSNGGVADVRIGTNDITGNGTGLLVQNGAHITSFGNNHIVGNTVNGAPTDSFLPS